MRTVVVVLALTVCSASIAGVPLPSIVDTSSRLEAVRAELENPAEVWGEGYYTLPPEDKALLDGPWRERLLLSMDLIHAEKYLLEGSSSAFYDQILILNEKLDKLSFSPEANESIRQRVVQLMALAFESGQIEISLEQFSAALNRLNLEFVSRWPDKFDWQRALAIRAYLHGNERELIDQILSTAPMDDGFAKLLLAELNGSQSRFEDAIHTLHAVYEGAENKEKGRTALHLAKAWLLQTRSDKQDQSLDQALLFADQARKELEYFDVPVFWGAAHRVTGEILEESRNRLDPELYPMLVQKLDQRIARAFELSRQ